MEVCRRRVEYRGLVAKSTAELLILVMVCGARIELLPVFCIVDVNFIWGDADDMTYIDGISSRPVDASGLGVLYHISYAAPEWRR